MVAIMMCPKGICTHMLGGLADEEVHHYLDDHPKLIPLIDIDVVDAVNPYVSRLVVEDQDTFCELDSKSVEELPHGCETPECELEISQQVKALKLE